MDRAKELFSFIQSSPSAFHAVKTLSGMLDASGYTKLQESEKWQLEKGKGYYVTRNLSSIIAFTVPECGFAPFQMCASHSDSPVFKLKKTAEVTSAGHFVQLDVENYGGMIMSTWFDRPLSVAGRVFVKTENGIGVRLVNIDKDTCVIPSVAIHMNRQVNDGYKINPAKDIPPLVCSANAKGSFTKEIAECAGAAPEDIIGSDLFLYNRMEGTQWGNDGEYISCGRLDDLECAFTSMQAFIEAKKTDHISMCIVFDNEEVGNRTRQGAESSFLSDVTLRIAHALGADDDTYRMALTSSFMLSADNAHSTHPNHPEYADPANQVFMNEGIVIKFNARQSYATDGIGEAIFRTILDNAKVPYQIFHNRSDLPGGGTLGNGSSCKVPVSTVDIGLAQLAMHSCYETAGAKDIGYMIDGIRAFYEAQITCREDGVYDIHG